MMDPRRKSAAENKGFKENDFSSFISQTKLSQSEEPTPKKPRLDITKMYNLKTTNCATQSINKKDTIDEIFWGDELNCDEIAQIEYDETIALTQIDPLTQSTAAQINKANEVKSSSRGPIRRFNSSQFPSSSTFSSYEKGKGPSNDDGFLQSELQKLKLENLKLKEEMNKKAGEAKLLRLKMKDSEKQYEKLTQTYLRMTNDLKKQSEHRSSILQKEIQSLKGQLDVKNMEIKTAERRALTSSSVNRIQPDSQKRLGALRPLGKDDLELDRSQMMQGLSLNFIRDSVTPELLKPSPLEANVSESVRTSNPRLFSSDVNPTVRRECNVSHTCVTQCAVLLLSPGLVDVTGDSSQQIISQVVDVCHKTLTELLKQLESAMCSNNRFIERERELLLSGSRQLPLDKNYDLISHRELYSDERGITARRSLGLMSLLVQASHFTAKRILASSPKESPDILDTVRNIVRQIEKQRRTLNYQGVLAGSVTLIQSLLNSATSVSGETQTLMVDVLRWVVSARPGSLVIHNILQALLVAAKFPQLIDSLCQNSAEKTFKEDSRISMIQFTPDSCILQVLCGLLKAVETPKKHQLTDLWTLWVLSLFCSGQPRPQWLSVRPTAKTCHCHSLACKLCFSLLSETCFAYPTASACDQHLMEKMLARGVLLMNTLMNEDEHLLAIADPHSLGCYEHFLHFMSDSKISLDSTTRDTLEFLCSQEEVLKQQGNSPNGEHNTNLHRALVCFKVGENGKKSCNVLDEIESLNINSTW